MSLSPSLGSVAQALVASGKGILAADESFPTIGKRFAALGIPANEETRRAYRELLFTAPHLGDWISGAILFDETFRQPPTVPGIVFLSGGQNDVAATEHFSAICRASDMPWKLTFSFGRALQDAAMKAWGGLPANSSSAQSALLHRARCNGLAVRGQYSAEVEHETKPHPTMK